VQYWNNKHAMTWIRNPLWDGIWILSGLPIGMVMVVAPINVMVGIFFVINTAHLIAPFVVAWGSGAFRQIMVKHWMKYILVPMCILVGTMILGVTVDKVYEVNPLTLGVRVYGTTDYQRPFVIMFVIYFFWNAYHFGMQNFGVVSLYRRMRRSRAQRRLDKWVCVIATFIGMIVIPRLLHIPQVNLFVLGFFAFNHSLTAIGISSHVLANNHARSPWLFAAALIIAGAIAFWLLFCAPGFATRVTMTILALRIGLGFVHFLYDRWVYKLSDPQVRAIIGKDIFRAAAG
jgi:hypothetical protein